MFNFSTASSSTPSQRCQCPQCSPGKGNKFSFNFRRNLPILQCSINAVKYRNSIRLRIRKKKANKKLTSCSKSVYASQNFKQLEEIHKKVNKLEVISLGLVKL